MNYTPTIWSNGMKITATRLNKLENGINNGSPTALIFSSHLTETPGESEINYTFNDIKNAYLSGRNPYLLYIDNSDTEEYSMMDSILYKQEIGDYYCINIGIGFYSNDQYSAENPDTKLSYIVQK